MNNVTGTRLTFEETGRRSEGTCKLRLQAARLTERLGHIVAQERELGKAEDLYAVGDVLVT